VPCDPSCSTCIEGLATDCLTCSLPRVLKDAAQPTECLDPCPTQFFSGPTMCMACHGTCNECTGVTVNDCLGCFGGQVIFGPTPGICEDVCTSTQFKVGISCFPCDLSCKTCSSGGLTGCTSCNAPDALFGNLIGQCVPVCPGGTYQNGTLCIDCHPLCDTCSGAT
jgi:proprotein convertase subtilisin/kexin type 5